MLFPLFAFCSVVLLLTGCVSNAYQAAKKQTPPQQLLNVPFPPAPLQTTLNTVITYNGPGSWKRDAFWDEYVVTVHNPGSQSLAVTSAELTDYSGTIRTPGVHPWALEKQSKTLEQRYRDSGVAFVRYTTPGAILLTVGTGVGMASIMTMSTGAATVASACIVAIPVYYIGVVTINLHNRAAMEKTFQQRRLVFPLTLAPGETRTGSCFFPMVPGPRSLRLGWASATDHGDATLPLDMLQGLHVKSPARVMAPSAQLPLANRSN